MDHEMDENFLFFGKFFTVMTLQGHTNQITCLIETMDKLTKEGEHRIATETLKACFGTFFCGLKSHFALLAILEMSLEMGLNPANQIVSCSDCIIVYKAVEILCLAPKNGCREDSSHCGNKKLSVTDDTNQCE